MHNDGGFLSGYFKGVGTKRLTRVDATRSSNQHEIGDAHGGESLMKVLGKDPRKKENRFPARYVWLLSEQEAISEEGFLSWYDTREKQKNRSAEWRLYYQSNPVTELMSEGDVLFVARLVDDTVLFIVVPADSSLLASVNWLFGLGSQSALEFEAIAYEGTSGGQVDFISRFILDELGIEFEDPKANEIDEIIRRYGTKFPSTREFSDMARLTVPSVDATDDPDYALVSWLDHEEAMFRRLEKRIVASRIKEGFEIGGEADVEAFIGFSLSVQNRRKSRMGYSFQNHLAAIFDAHELRYDPQVTTENNRKPDFIFPGASEYFDPDFSAELLTMLAAKSSCKDRWTQVLPEAERIGKKHLVTLEPGIASSLTESMRSANVQLIAPEKIRQSYSDTQREWVMSVGDLVAMLRHKQTRMDL